MKLTCCKGRSACQHRPPLRYFPSGPFATFAGFHAVHLPLEDQAMVDDHRLRSLQAPRTLESGMSEAVSSPIFNRAARTIDPIGGTTAALAQSNLLLRLLPPASLERLVPHLEPVRLMHGQILWQPNEPIKSVYFPQTCVASLVVPLHEEPPVEAATVGWEGLVGMPVVLGAESTMMQALIQIPGEALRLTTAVLHEAIAEGPAVLKVLLRYGHALQEQISQSVACNARHSIDERCARWLLLTHDRVGGADFPLTQEFLARMLGVRRASVTTAAGMLQAAGMIHYTRGHIRVLDRQRLEAASCECYQIVQARYDRLLDGGPVRQGAQRTRAGL
jgi:CRP-like cAMP-binding protein